MFRKKLSQVFYFCGKDNFVYLNFIVWSISVNQSVSQTVSQMLEFTAEYLYSAMILVDCI